MKKAPDEFCVERSCTVCRQPVFYDGFTYEGYNTFDGKHFYCLEHWGDEGEVALAYEEGREG